MTGAWGDTEDFVAEHESAGAGELCVIWSGEHRAYWRANASGYVTILDAAGVYKRGEAERLTRGCCPQKKIEIRPVEMVTFKVTVPREI